MQYCKFNISHYSGVVQCHGIHLMDEDFHISIVRVNDFTFDFDVLYNNVLYLKCLIQSTSSEHDNQMHVYFSLR